MSDLVRRGADCLPALPSPSRALTSVGLFAGVGGIELGLERAGFRAVELVEIEPHARVVLETHFPESSIKSDIIQVERLTPATIVSAGFPCKDLSSAGTKRGIDGIKSGLVRHVFRLLQNQPGDFEWLLLENVPGMLERQAGAAMDVITSALDELGYAWAYRQVDLRCFGVPQRRERVLLLASPVHDPRPVLLGQDAGAHRGPADPTRYFGFSPQEGRTGLGWVVSGVPTLRVGGDFCPPIVSPPAIWRAADAGDMVVPDVRDAERLQTFPADWTRPLMAAGFHPNWRWQGIGNAVPPVLSYWVGSRIRTATGDPFDASTSTPKGARKWSACRSAWSSSSGVMCHPASRCPVACAYVPLRSFLAYAPTLLSHAWSRDWWQRYESGRMHPPEEFLRAMAQHIDATAPVDSNVVWSDALTALL